MDAWLGWDQYIYPSEFDQDALRSIESTRILNDCQLTSISQWVIVTLLNWVTYSNDLVNQKWCTFGMQLKCMSLFYHRDTCTWDLIIMWRFSIFEQYTMLSTYSSWESEILIQVSQWVLVKCILCCCMIGENYKKKTESRTIMFNFIPRYCLESTNTSIVGILWYT